MWRTEPGKFYGLRAQMSIWGSPDQQVHQESGASILVSCEKDGRLASVQAGFHVKTNSLDSCGSSRLHPCCFARS